MQLVSKAKRQAHPWEARLDNKKASLKVKEGERRFKKNKHTQSWNDVSISAASSAKHLIESPFSG